MASKIRKLFQRKGIKKPIVIVLFTVTAIFGVSNFKLNKHFGSESSRSEVTKVVQEKVLPSRSRNRRNTESALEEFTTRLN